MWVQFLSNANNMYTQTTRTSVYFHFSSMTRVEPSNETLRFFDGDVIPLLTPCCCRAARVKAACQQRHTSISPLSVSALDRFSRGAHMHSEACWQSPLWNNVLNLRLTALIKKDLARVLHQKRPACSILRPPLFPKIEILSRIISLVWQHLTVGLHMFTLCPGKTVTLS